MPVFSWLYIEDNEADAQLVKMILREHRPDIRLIIAPDGDEAIQLLESTRSGEVPDLVMTDLTLTRCDGVDLIRRIRRLQNCHAIPIVVFTSMEPQVGMQQCLQVGATSYVAKSGDLEGMISAICGIASRYCVERPAAQNEPYQMNA